MSNHASYRKLYLDILFPSRPLGFQNVAVLLFYLCYQQLGCPHIFIDERFYVACVYIIHIYMPDHLLSSMVYYIAPFLPLNMPSFVLNAHCIGIVLFDKNKLSWTWTWTTVPKILCCFHTTLVGALSNSLMLEFYMVHQLVVKWPHASCIHV